MPAADQVHYIEEQIQRRREAQSSASGRQHHATCATSGKAAGGEMVMFHPQSIPKTLKIDENRWK